MLVGIPKEIKNNENRVAITPAGVNTLKLQGHTIYVQATAGVGSGFSDEEYIKEGAIILDSIEEVYANSDMIMKVKEPQPCEYPLFKKGQVLFTYLHLAPEPELTKALIDSHVVAIAYETVQLPDSSLPLLIPMSEVAGRMAVQIGAQFLEKHYGGRGMLLGGVPGVQKGKVVILGGGIVGTNAAKIAVGLGAQVTILDKSLKRLRELDDLFGNSVQTMISNSYNLREELKEADLYIGAVLIPGKRAPKLVSEDMVKTMKKGSVIIDVAIDQGGTVETIDRITTHSEPVYEKHGVIHYAVANMPGAVARTSTFALTNATIDYALKIANGWEKALMNDPSLAKGLNVCNGKVTYKAVADDLNLPYTPVSEVLY